jgi:hypothetical protein
MSLKDDIEKLKEAEIQNRVDAAANKGYLKGVKDSAIKMISFCIFIGGLLVTAGNWLGHMAYEYIPAVKIGYDAFQSALRGKE